MAEEIIKARVWTKVDTLENWNNNPLLLGPGEMALVTTPSGVPLNMKWGDKNERKRFSDLPFVISYDQGQFVAIDGPGELPTPESDVAYSLVGPGTYTYPGQDDIVVEDGHWGQVVYSDGEWSFIDMGDLPQPEIDSTDVILGESSLLTTETAVYNYSTPLFSPRILPTGYEFIDIDRPDLELDPLTIVDDEMNIIPFGAGDIPDGALYLDLSYDRPDLGLTFIDEDGYVIYSLPINGGGDVDEEKVRRIANEEIGISDFLEWYTEFGAQDPMPVEPGPTLEEYYEEWDDIMDNKINNPDYPNYITKVSLGKSTQNDKDIYRYDFKPIRPKAKVVLVGCTHGWEKNPSYALRRFFSYFVDNWSKSPMMQWARHNIHFIVIPVLSAGQYIPSPFPGGAVRGTRRVLETQPFPATWTKSGSNVTVTFDVADFPDTGGRLNGAEYFSHPGVAGKVWLSVTETSDDLGFPVGAHRIETVVDGTTISTNQAAGGASSGTCMICVDVDPNRQYQVPNPTWEDYVSNGTIGQNTPISAQDNKGTRPFSINESIYMRDLLQEEDDGTLLMLLDFHAGAGKYVTYYDEPSAADLTPILVAQEIVSDFHTNNYVLNGHAGNLLATYASQVHGIIGFTPEWSWSGTLSATDATNQQRWFINLILILSRFYYSQKLKNN